MKTTLLMTTLALTLTACTTKVVYRYEYPDGGDSLCATDGGCGVDAEPDASLDWRDRMHGDKNLCYVDETPVAWCREQQTCTICTPMWRTNVSTDDVFGCLTKDAPDDFVQPTVEVDGVSWRATMCSDYDVPWVQKNHYTYELCGSSMEPNDKLSMSATLPINGGDEVLYISVDLPEDDISMGRDTTITITRLTETGTQLLTPNHCVVTDFTVDYVPSDSSLDDGVERKLDNISVMVQYHCGGDEEDRVFRFSGLGYYEHWVVTHTCTTDDRVDTRVYP